MVEALIPAQNVSRVILLLEIVLQPEYQLLQTENAPGVPPRRFLADLVEILDLELSIARRIVQLHQVLHVLPEDVGAADLPAITGEQIIVQALVRSRSSAVSRLLRRALLRRLRDPVLARLEGRAREGRQFRR